MSLRALVVGLGQIGMGYDFNHEPDQFVLTHARAFERHPAFNLVGGVDSVSKRLSLFEAEYKCPGYKNLESALKELNPDVVAIATPTQTHNEIIRTTIKNCKPKVVICEKPLAYDASEATAMVEACEVKGIRLFVNYIRRSDKGVVEIKRRIEKGSISQPIKGVCWYSKGLFNNGSHFLNLLQYWLGEIKDFKVINKGRLWNNEDPEPDFKVEFELGSVVFLAVYEENYSHYTVELICANGRLEYAQGSSQIRWQSVINDPYCDGYRILNPAIENISTDLSNIQLCVLEQLINNLNGNESSLCTAREALITLKMLSKIENAL